MKIPQGRRPSTELRRAAGRDAGHTAEEVLSLSGITPSCSEAGREQLSRWSLALPASSGVAAIASVFHWLCEKGSPGKGDGKPLTLSNWPAFGDGETEVKGAGDRKSKVGQGRVLPQCVYSG